MVARADLLVCNGTLVTSTGRVHADLAIRDGRIAGIGEPGSLTGDDALDATDRYVLPGVIDAHVHFREPGLEYKEDFLTGSRAAVMGGVTTVLDMPNTTPPTASAAQVERKRTLIENRVYCDVGVFGLLVPGQLEAMAQAGVVGFKCFLGPTTGDIQPPDDGTLLEGLRQVARLGMRCAVHAENDDIIQHAVATLKANGRRDPLAHVEARPVLAEVESIQRVALLALHSGACLHIVHTSTREGLASVTQWRGIGVDVTCEVTPHHCFLTVDDMRRLGSIARINPPLREAGHGDALLAGLGDGRVTSIATDHSPHAPGEKLRDDIWQAVSGFPGVELSLRLFLTHAVHTGRLSLEQLVRATSEGPARTWGLYPRKGALQVGSDADLTIVDLEREDVIEAARMHGKNNLSPYEGWTTRGAAVATIVRGMIVMRDGVLVGPPRGRFTRRVSAAELPAYG